MSVILGLPLVQNLAWSLLHFLWQGACLGLLAWAGLRLMRFRGPQARYLFACAMLATMLAAPAGTFVVLQSQRPDVVVQVAPRIAPSAPPQASGTLSAEPGGRTAASSLRNRLKPVLPWALGAWFLGVALLSARLLGGWIWLRRKLWRDSEPACSDWQLSLRALARRLGIRREVSLMKALSLDRPMVIGWLEPIVLVPAAALAGMDPLALQAIFVHELAHVKRYDYLVNLLQSAVETLLFYHPAVWWLSRVIRVERENCCDDQAVAFCGDPVFYARALAHLEGLRKESILNPELAVAANGGSLMNRIQRLIQPNLPPSPRARAGLVAALAVSLLGAGAAATVAEEQAKERTEIVVHQDENTVKVKMKGDVTLDPGSKEGVKLGEGASFELTGVDKEHKTRRYTAKKEGAELKVTYKIAGDEKPLDAEGQAWLKKHLEELKELQAKIVKVKADVTSSKDDKKEIELKIQEGLETDDRTCDEPGKTKESKKVIVMRSGTGGKGDHKERTFVFRHGKGGHAVIDGTCIPGWKDVHKEICLHAETFKKLHAEELKKIEEDRKNMSKEDFEKKHGEELRKIEEDSRKLAEEGRKLGEEVRKHAEILRQKILIEDGKVVVPDGAHKKIYIHGRDLEDLDIHIPEIDVDLSDLDCLDKDVKVFRFKTKPRSHEGRKAEMEHVKQEIQMLQKRLEKLQQASEKDAKSAQEKVTSKAESKKKTPEGKAK